MANPVLRAAYLMLRRLIAKVLAIGSLGTLRDLSLHCTQRGKIDLAETLVPIGASAPGSPWCWPPRLP
ncbi:hypothetical protein HYQ46_012592 [Verticillium longisporum]|nr:hypothetical protein HYQ46_012592 [Verticillium longisporum]